MMGSVHRHPKVDVQREELIVTPAVSLHGAAGCARRFVAADFGLLGVSSGN